MKKIIITSSFLLASLTLSAQGTSPVGTPITGNQFDLAFSDPDSRVLGLVAAIRAVEKDPAIGAQICPPAGITQLQAAKILDKYMQDNPNQLQLYMHDLALLALFGAFPCR
ncbi:hypothetical protein EGY19_05310 [Burkholderia multivorans]|nr:hypothetical protein EGY19_05310 [Burkholderia multivorans]